MFKHWMEIVDNYDNGHLDWLFNQNVFLLSESASIMSGNIAKDSNLRNYLEDHSLSSEQVFLSIQSKPFS